MIAGRLAQKASAQWLRNSELRTIENKLFYKIFEGSLILNHVVIQSYACWTEIVHMYCIQHEKQGNSL